jgi:hypothetical protein
VTKEMKRFIVELTFEDGSKWNAVLHDEPKGTGLGMANSVFSKWGRIAMGMTSAPQMMTIMVSPGCEVVRSFEW